MFWPTVLSHKIDSDSPLWEVTARDISNKQFEIVLTFEGTTPETGNTVQVRENLPRHRKVFLKTAGDSGVTRSRDINFRVDLTKHAQICIPEIEYYIKGPHLLRSHTGG